MSDPLLGLQGAVVSRLKADVATTALVAQRVFDAVPAGAVFPYITLGGGQQNGDDIDCADISETFFQIHGWSRSVGWPEAKNIARAIRDALKAPLAITGFDIQIQEYQQTQLLDDPDGLTRHAMVEFRFIIVHT
jgi:hypothetical protein